MKQRRLLPGIRRLLLTIFPFHFPYQSLHPNPSLPQAILSVDQ